MQSHIRAAQKQPGQQEEAGFSSALAELFRGRIVKRGPGFQAYQHDIQDCNKSFKLNKG